MPGCQIGAALEVMLHKYSVTVHQRSLDQGTPTNRLRACLIVRAMGFATQLDVRSWTVFLVKTTLKCGHLND